MPQQSQRTGQTSLVTSKSVIGIEMQVHVVTRSDDEGGCIGKGDIGRPLAVRVRRCFFGEDDEGSLVAVGQEAAGLRKSMLRGGALDG